MAAITQQACLLWNIARGKGAGYTESKIEISLMDDFSQQSVPKCNANDFGEKQQLQTAISLPKGPIPGISHIRSSEQRGLSLGDILYRN